MSYKYWDYYLVLERDLMETFRYVDFSEANMKTNSIEFASIILATCAEIDMVFKQVCMLLGVRKCKNIKNYREAILTNRPEFNSRERKTPYSEEPIKPFRDWSLQHGKNPDWWRAYNKIKHERYISFHRASLKNAILSLAALQIVLFEFYSIQEDSNSLQFKYYDAPRLILPQPDGTAIVNDEGIYIRYLVT